MKHIFFCTIRMEKLLWFQNLTMAMEANTSINPNIIGLLSARNKEKASHENLQGGFLHFSWQQKEKNYLKRHFFLSLTTDQVLTVPLHKKVLWSSHPAAGFLFPSGTFVWLSHKKQKPVIASILSNAWIVMLQWPQKQIPATKKWCANAMGSWFAPVQHRPCH